MPMSRHLFRPAAGQTVASYTAAVASATMYPGDWVQLNAADAPTAQGVSGVFGGKTLGTYDYIECVLLVTTGLGCSILAMGALMGKSIAAVNDWTNVAAQVVADQDVVVIQRWGIHPNTYQAATAVLGDYLYASSTAGRTDNDATAGITLTTGANLLPIGVALTAGANYTRSATVSGCVTYVRC